MKYTILTSTFLLASALAIPTEYPAPPGGWESIDYPPPPGGWENVKYPPGTGHGPDVVYPPGTGANPAPKCDSPFVFTSVYHVKVVGSEVRNGTAPAPGPTDAIGYFNFGINSEMDTICYNITLLNITDAYSSPALTATHIHQAPRGSSGPPRIAFPNPVGDDKKRVSVGCLTGPFRTGILANGVDTGNGFKVRQIEENPEGFFADSHTVGFTLGVVRGQVV